MMSPVPIRCTLVILLFTGFVGLSSAAAKAKVGNMVLYVATRGTVITGISPPNDALMFEMSTTLILTWSIKACGNSCHQAKDGKGKASGVKADLVGMPITGDDDQPYDLPFLMVQNGYNIVAKKIRQSVSDDKVYMTVTVQVSGNFYADYHKWKYPFDSANFRGVFQWSQSTYIKGDTIQMRKCSNWYHIPKDPAHQDPKITYPGEWYPDTRCDVNNWGSTGDHKCASSNSDARKCIVSDMIRPIFYLNQVGRPVRQAYWMGTWFPMQIIVVTQAVVTGILANDGSVDNFSGSIKAYIFSFIMLFDRSRGVNGSFDFHSFFALFAILTNTTIFLMHGFGIAFWQRFENVIHHKYHTNEEGTVDAQQVAPEMYPAAKKKQPTFLEALGAEELIKEQLSSTNEESETRSLAAEQLHSTDEESETSIRMVDGHSKNSSKREEQIAAAIATREDVLLSVNNSMLLNQGWCEDPEEDIEEPFGRLSEEIEMTCSKKAREDKKRVADAKIKSCQEETDVNIHAETREFRLKMKAGTTLFTQVTLGVYILVVLAIPVYGMFAGCGYEVGYNSKAANNQDNRSE